MNRVDEFEAIRHLRCILTQVKGRLSEKSKADYLKKYAHMLKCQRGPEGVAKTVGSYYAYRAALIYGTAEEARHALKLRDKAKAGSPEWQIAMDKIFACLCRFERYPPDPAKKHHESGSASFTWQDVRGAKPAKRHSKKYLLSALQKRGDWQNRFFEAVPSQHKEAVAVMQLTGCRPSELAQGIQVKLLNGQLAFLIQGSKVTARSGQESRLLLVRPDSIVAAFLIAGLSEGGCKTISIGNQKSFAEVLAVVGERVFPRLRGRISPYVFRHAFSSDLKSACVSPEQIACAMGHQVTRTQERYGRSSHGRGTTALVASQACVGIRDTRRDPRRLSQAHIPTSSPALTF